jgi:ankyrin repeat protein
MLLLGMTPLMFALHHEGNKAIVKYLINNHADPNKGANSGIAPLHIAATEGFFCPCVCVLCHFKDLLLLF